MSGSEVNQPRLLKGYTIHQVLHQHFPKHVDLPGSSFVLGHLHGSHSKLVTISIEQDVLAQSFRSLTSLNPLAPSRTIPKGFQETKWSIFGVGQVVLAHNGLNSFSGFIGMVERNRGYVVMEDMSLDYTVEKRSTYKSKFTVYCRCGSSSESPGFVTIMRDGWIGVLKVGNSNCKSSQFRKSCSWRDLKRPRAHLASD